VARAEAYLHAKIDLDPSNCLATIHQRYRQDRTDGTDRQRSDSIGHTVFGRPFVKRFALRYQTVVCLSVSVCLSVCLYVLSVTLVYCGQTVGWIKKKLGMEVGLGSGHIVLDGDPAPPPQRGADRPFPQILGPGLLWANGWMDQDRSWHGGI